MPGTFTPTPEQLALREARRLQKEKAATNASTLVNNEKGQILSRPWLAVQDSHTNATLSTKIMTWNVRNFVFCSCVHSDGQITISVLIQLLPALGPMPRP